MLIRGSNLTTAQRQQVLTAFVHRHLAIGPSGYYFSETGWLVDHAFYFTKNGARLRLYPRYCEPYYMADTAGRM